MSFCLKYYDTVVILNLYCLIKNLPLQQQIDILTQDLVVLVEFQGMIQGPFHKMVYLIILIRIRIKVICKRKRDIALLS